MSEYIISANNALINLEDMANDFEKEAKVINYAKCYLINNKTLQDFIIDGIEVYVSGDQTQYYLYYDGVELKLDVDNGVIIDYATN